MARCCHGSPDRGRGYSAVAQSPRPARAMARRGLALGVALGQHLPLVVRLAAPGQRQLDLGPAVLEVQRQRDQRQVLLVDDVAQPVELGPVQQQLAPALGLVAGVLLRVGVDADVHRHQPRLVALEPGEGVADLGVRRRAATSPRCHAAPARPRRSRAPRSCAGRAGWRRSAWCRTGGRSGRWDGPWGTDQGTARPRPSCPGHSGSRPRCSAATRFGTTMRQASSTSSRTSSSSTASSRTTTQL